MKTLSSFFLSLILSFLHIAHLKTEKVDLVIYSYNRPMQLYAFLESIDKFVTGTGTISIIYRVDDKNYENAYELVKSDFSKMEFFKQGQNPHADFKPLVKKCGFETPNKYVSFAVDDIIVKDFVDLEECTAALKKTESYSFLLRVGLNIDYCFMKKLKTPVPYHEWVVGDIYTWKFSDGAGDWIFPSNNDMTIYRKTDIEQDLMSLNFRDTHYEGYWALKADLNKKGLCFEQSKIVNITANLVQNSKRNYRQFTNEWKSKMHLYTTEELLRKFNDGLKIDITAFYKITNRAPHIEQEYVFIERK